MTRADLIGVRASLLGGRSRSVERFAPEHLPAEDAAEAARGGVDCALHRDGGGGGRLRARGEVTPRSRMPQGTIQSKSRRSVVTLSAKPCEVTPCETWTPMAASLRLALLGVRAGGPVRGTIAGSAAAEGPDAGALGDALGHDAEVGAGADQRFFQHADEVDGAEEGAALAGPVAAQIDDGVADELAGAVVGHVAAAVDLVQLDAAGGEELIAGEDVGAGRVAAEGDDGRMLQQQQRVADEACLARGNHAGLDGEAFGVRNAAEMEEVDVQMLRQWIDRSQPGAGEAASGWRSRPYSIVIDKPAIQIESRADHQHLDCAVSHDRQDSQSCAVCTRRFARAGLDRVEAL